MQRFPVSINQIEVTLKKKKRKKEKTPLEKDARQNKRKMLHNEKKKRLH